MDIDSLMNYNVDVKTGTLYLGGNIELTSHTDLGAGEDAGLNWLTFDRFLKGMNLLEETLPLHRGIKIHLNTIGGDCDVGLAIYDVIKMSPRYVTIVVSSGAYSMGSVVFQAGDVRLMTPNAKLMIHEGYMDSSGTPKMAKSLMRVSDIIGEKMMDIYLDSMERSGQMEGQPRSKIRRKLISLLHKHDDLYLTSIEALDLGLADGIIS